MNSPPQRSESHSTNPHVPAPWQPRFTLGTLMLVTLVCCVTAAGGYYLVRSMLDPNSRGVTFVMFTLAAPPLLLLIVAGARHLLDWLERRS